MRARYQQPEARDHAGGYVLGLLRKGAISVNSEDHGERVVAPPVPGGAVLQRPTEDQMYLADRINDTAPKARLTPAALQKLNAEFGVRIVSDALRYVRGFPPDELRSAYPYVRAICRRQLKEWTA